MGRMKEEFQKIRESWFYDDLKDEEYFYNQFKYKPINGNGKDSKNNKNSFQKRVGKS